MNVDVLVAFGGVALIGAVGFVAAWFSVDGESKAGACGSTKAQRKKLVIAKIAEVEEELHSVSSKIASL